MDLVKSQYDVKVLTWSFTELVGKSVQEKDEL